MFLTEWKYVLHTKGLLKIILGILLVPTFYAVIFLASLWNPYDNVKHLPIGIVDNDVLITKNHTDYHLGKDLTRRLTQSKTADFKSLNSKTANDDLKAGRLYMVLTIPKDFSQRATQLGQRAFKPINFNYHTNAGFSFIGMKMMTTTAEKVQAAVSAQLTTSYLSVMAQTLRQTGNQLGSAHDALNQTGHGLQQVASGEQQLATADRSLSQQESRLQGGLQRLSTGTAQTLTGLKAIAQNDDHLAALSPATAGNTPTSIQTVMAKEQALTQALATPHPDWRAIQAINTQLSQAIAQLSSSTTPSKSAQTAHALVTRNDQLVAQLAAGSQQAQTGIAALSQGTTQLSTGAATIANHLSKLTTSTRTIQQANGQLGHQLQIGANQLTSGSNNAKQQLKNTVAPVRLVHTDTTHVKNNGTGMTPYLMSVALFVGCITFNIIYDMFTPHRRPKNALAWWGEKMPFFLTFTFLAASTMYGLLLLVNHLDTTTTTQNLGVLRLNDVGVW